MGLFKRRDFFFKSFIGLIGAGFLLSLKKPLKDNNIIWHGETDIVVIGSGTGLGLVIARDLINEMQGKIQVYSPVKTQWLPSYLKEQDLLINGGTTVLIWLHCEY